jgi:Domain of unknown function (DUF5615)
MNGDPIRYHLDESVDVAIADGLRRRGIDVTTSVEAGLLSAPDVEQLAWAASVNRGLVSRGVISLIINRATSRL